MRARASVLPWLLAAATVLAQVAYPLVAGSARDGLTIATVLLFCAASLTHAVLSRGLRTALTVLALAGGTGLLAEAVGTATGVPFGAYAYADTLGPKVAMVPVVIPLAWTMMAWPALLVGRRLTRSAPLGVVVTAVALASWDLFLDPQMVDAGHWTWAHPTPSLPGVPGIPLTNYAGWLLVAAVLAALLHRLVPTGATEVDRDGPALALYLWTYVGSVLANAVFFDRPGVAAVGGVGMGLVAVPLLLNLRHDLVRLAPAALPGR